jgi:hypothetical protein
VIVMINLIVNLVSIPSVRNATIIMSWLMASVSLRVIIFARRLDYYPLGVVTNVILKSTLGKY